MRTNFPINLKPFPQGGFVMHKVRVDGSLMLWSVWVDAMGNATDAEGRNESFTITGRKPLRNGPVWRELERKAKRVHKIYFS